MNRKTLINTLLVALFAALISVGAYIKVVIVPPVPITLQTLFVLLAGLLLPLKLSVSSILIYLFIGAIGLPVFTSGGGLGALFGPTGGYLFGTLPAVLIGGMIMKINPNNELWVTIIIAILQTISIYVMGLPWLAISSGLSIQATFFAGFVPFLFGDTLKIIIAAVCTKTVKSKIDNMLAKVEVEY